MSDHCQRVKDIGSGTNSPPAADEKPMGRASVDSPIDAGHISDREQRKEYFEHASDKKAEANKSQNDKKMGQSMAASMEQRGH
ncbi:hypothetical protein JR316_0008902 [Psilocybe cubensis]|uniref:Uncharacterized protein n=2 Tax=Psilocybe cubensis TaxID=181762 RepID=A0A8H7XYS2_PSICU|nr:hypothetical protein JR316_0008902 [Psilocybe cubensis]KAH9478447.1 hypothetical protein JR316_0008902 [Psilocybe cubensis]